MDTFHERAALRARLQEARARGRRIGLLPTMGNLHSGHIALLEDLRRVCDISICSIFVNPTQFGAGEDFERYPRTLPQDQERLSAAGCDLLFAPSIVEMYPHGLTTLTTVTVQGLQDCLCGAHRPGHFQGVASVVSKLFNIVQPDVAIFGEKDYQQLAVLRRMTLDLDFPVQILAGATRRDADGLALSSRNQYLRPDERQRAPMLYRTLQQMRDAILSGIDDYRMLESSATGLLEKSGFHTDYFSVVDADSLQPAGAQTRRLTLLVAARLGETRLIDNISLDLAAPTAT